MVAVRATRRSTPESRVQDREYLDAALAAARWIKSHEIVTEHGVSWPAAPLESKDDAWWTLYSGSPGVILFFIELSKITGDEAWLDDAKRGADQIIGMAADSANLKGEHGFGLYVGYSGVAWVMTALWQATGDQKYRDAVDSFFDVASEIEGATLKSPVYDIISGEAGFGLAIHGYR